ncbi:MAG: universal stress protein [Alphaproteobacteria bacterium]|nr:universal stress protein [Alphaproteobacteria bacterium]
MSEGPGQKASEDSAAPTRARAKKILIVADRSPECRLALQFAGLRALHTGGRLALLYISEPADFQHWLGVEAIMREEARAEAENVLHTLGTQVNRETGIVVEYAIREGRKREVLIRHIEEDPDIRLLVLGAGTGKEGPGPLVSAMAGEVAASFPVPVTIVPGQMTPEEIEALA